MKGGVFCKDTTFSNFFWLCCSSFKPIVSKKSQLHIGFDAKRLFNNKRGLATYARTLLLSLRSQFPDIHIYLYTPKIKSPYKLIEFKDDPGFIIRTYNGPFSWYWRSNGMVKQLEIDNIELFHGLSSELPRGLHKANIKSVVTIHDLLWKKHTNDYTIADRIILDSKLKNAIKKADKIIAVSEQTKENLSDFVNINTDKLKLISQIAGPEFYKDTLKEHPVNLPDKYILAFADKKNRKNLDLLLNTIELLKDKEIALVLIGATKKQKFDSEKVYSVPHIPYEDLKLYYENALFCAYPSKDEGFGLPVVESLMRQTPVVVMNKPPMNQFKHPLVHTFPPSASPEQLASIFEKVIKEPKAILKYTSPTSIENYARQYMDVYLSVLGY